MISLKEEKLRQALPELYQNMEIRLFQVLDSTNSEAKRALRAGCPLPALFLAEAQSAGRGRQGKDFFSPPGSGLYMSLALAKPGDVGQILSLTTMAAVAACRAIRGLTGLAPAIKWVNDLYLDGKKICGILAEGTPGGVVIGIGINTGPVVFPPELAETAASLDRPALDRNRLAASVTAELLKLYTAPEDKAYMEDYRAWSLVLGRRVRYGSGGSLDRQGLVQAVEEDGALVIQGPAGQEILRSGEVSLRLDD